MGARRGRGEGGVEELPSGKWRAVLSLGTRGGKRRRLCCTKPSKKEALAWLRRRQAERDRGELADAGKTTLGEWLAEWLAAKRSKVEAATYKFYRNRVNNHLLPAAGHHFLAKLSPRDVEAMHATLTGKGVPAGEQRRCATTLRAALNDAVKHGLIPSNPAKRVARPKAPALEVRPLDAEQARRLLAAVEGTRLQALYWLWLDTGCRPGELFGLHWPDVDLHAGEVFIRQSLSEVDGKLQLKAPKTAKGRRKIVLANGTLRELLAHQKRMNAESRDVFFGPVFPDRRGGLLRQCNVWRWSFRPALRRAGLPLVRPYDLRHTCATLLLAAGVNIRVVSERLGHERIETTLRHYIHLLPGQQRAAAVAIEALFGGEFTSPVRSEGGDNGG